MNTQRVAPLALLVTCLLGLLAIQPSAEAGSRKRPPRIEEQTYVEPAYGVAYPAYNMVFCQTGCVIFDLLPRERYVSLSVDDAVGPDVAIAVFPWDGAERYQRYDHCTRTEPLRVPRWATHVWVEVLIGPCSDGTPAAATQGTVTATFFVRPR